jgi:hypothetical protein
VLWRCRDTCGTKDVCAQDRHGHETGGQRAWESSNFMLVTASITEEWGTFEWGDEERGQGLESVHQSEAIVFVDHGPKGAQLGVSSTTFALLASLPATPHPISIHNRAIIVRLSRIRSVYCAPPFGIECVCYSQYVAEYYPLQCKQVLVRLSVIHDS